MISSGHFCAAPFTQLVLEHNGFVLPCGMLCNYKLGSVTNMSIQEIWNGEKLRTLRREFLSDEIKICANMINLLQCNQCYAHLISHVVQEEIQTSAPKRLDVRLNGRCNLQCIMCQVWNGPNGIYDSVGFWEKGPTEIFPQLVEMCVLGGEPFIQNDTFRLIQEVSTVNTDCLWEFTTNANWKLSDKIKNSLNLINIHYIAVSIDSLDPVVYPTIRISGNLDLALRTIDDLVDYRKERFLSGQGYFNLCMRMVVRTDNYREIPEFIQYANQRKIHPAFNFQRYPPNLGGFVAAPNSLKKEALSYLEDCFQTTQCVSLIPVLDQLKQLSIPTIGDQEIRHA